MERMPFEILEFILKKLDLMSLFRCRLVNRSWNELIKTIRLRNLAIGEDLKDVGYFFMTRQPIKSSNYLIASKYNLHKNKLMKNLLSNLRSLYLKDAPFKSSKRDFDLDGLFKESPLIEQLHIDNLRAKGNGIIKSNRLKSLTIIQLKSSHIEIESTSLFKFRSETILSKFQFSEPANLIYLSLNYYNGDVKKFTNLEKFFCRFGSSIPIDLLDRNLKLKELHCRTISPTRASDLLNQIKLSRRRDLRFFLRGFSIDNVEEVDNFIGYNFDLKLDPIKSFYPAFTENQSRFSDQMPWYQFCNYTDLTKVISSEFIENFFDKFINLKRILVTFNDKQSIDLFKQFISRCTYIDDLILYDVSLDEKFYAEELKLFCPYLINLKIKTKKRTINDLNFIFNYDLLISFSINQQLNHETIKRLFKFKCFELVEFSTRNHNNVKIFGKQNRNNFISIDGNTAFFHSKTSMIQFLDQLFLFKLNYL